jgi:hypothetical protein
MSEARSDIFTSRLPAGGKMPAPASTETRVLRHFFFWTSTALLALLLPVPVAALQMAGGAGGGWLMPLAIAAALVLAVRCIGALLRSPRELRARDR